MGVDRLAEASKDDLILAMLAVLGGESREINERDLFLASWHAFPNTMRWVDTALPNPDSFTASLRRLDQRGHIKRVGKQERQKGGSRSRRKTVLDAGRSGVVKARIPEGALEKAGVDRQLIDEVGQLRPDRDQVKALSLGALIAVCAGLREAEGRHLDEGALAELAFHKFPDRFAYEQRPEFPDLERIREAVRAAMKEGLLDDELALTRQGQDVVQDWQRRAPLRLDASEAHKAGDLKVADRIERSPAYWAWAENETLVATKPDELFRALRIPPTTDPRPIADTLSARIKLFRRIDKAELATYLMEVARRHNAEVVALLEQDDEREEEEVAGPAAD